MQFNLMKNIFTGGGDGVIRAIDCNTGNIITIGQPH